MKWRRSEKTEMTLNSTQIIYDDYDDYDEGRCFFQKVVGAKFENKDIKNV